MDLKGLLKEWRVLLLFAVLGLSVVGLQPTYVNNNGDYQLKLTGLEDNLGTDFTGGTRLLLSVESNATGEDLRKLTNDVASTLRLRANNLETVKDPSINTVNVDGWKIRVVGNVDENRTDSSLKEIIASQGRFEARVTLPVSGEKTVNLGKDYRFVKNGANISVETPEGEERTYGPGSDFELNGFRIYYINQSSEVSNLEILSYTGEGLADIGSVENGARYRMTRYDWVLPITLKKDAARDFQTVTDNFESSGGPDARYIHDDGSNVQLKYYLDSDLKQSLSIGASGGGDLPTDRIIQIPADEQTEEARLEAEQETERIRTILNSGSLEVPIKVESKTELGSSLGDDFMKVSVISIALSLFAVAMVVFIRYRRPKIVLPLFLTGSSEVFILFGLWFSTFGELTLSAVAGIIAAVGTGVDDQIIITDESGREKVRSWSKRMKTAFFVIFTSAASTTGAMVPIIHPGISNIMLGLAGAGLIGYNYYSRKTNPHYLAIGMFAVLVSILAYPIAGTGDALISIRGFATTTIIGIMIGIAVTRPAYSKVLEYIEE